MNARNIGKCCQAKKIIKLTNINSQQQNTYSVVATASGLGNILGGAGDGFDTSLTGIKSESNHKPL